MSILDIASKMEAELSEKEQAIRDREVAVAEKEAQLLADKKDFDAKKKELAEVEKSIKKEAEEVSIKVQKIRRDEEITKAIAESELNKEASRKTLKEANEKLGDAKQILEEISKREIALTKREAEYKETIKKEIVEGFLKGIKL